ncbi:MAG: LysR family transcriptional regulator [Nibricoccus sp.]
MFDTLFAERGLSLDRLKVLVEVQDAGSIAQAAPGDPIRQSQYSRQLRELSEFFGVEVTKRQGKILKLTVQGARLAELARNQLRSLQDFRSECHAGCVEYSIAAGDNLLQWLVLPRLGQVSHGKTPMRFSTYNHRTNEIVQQLNDGRIDFGLIRRDAVGEGLKSAPLGDVPFVAVVPRKLVSRVQQLTLEEVLAKVPLVAQTTDGQFAQKLRALTEECGAAFAPTIACQSFPHALSAVRSGHFAAILPKLALTDLAPVDYVVIESKILEQLKRPIVLVWNPRLVAIRPGAAHLVAELRRVLQLK